MVLGDDLIFVLVVEDEVLDVIQQSLRGKRPAITPSRLVPFCLICLAVNLLFLIISAKPVEEMLPFRRDAANLRLDGV